VALIERWRRNPGWRANRNRSLLALAIPLRNEKFVSSETLVSALAADAMTVAQKILEK
jgi:hypothetical protein